jgi:hypothetical protein
MAAVALKTVARARIKRGKSSAIKQKARFV